MDSSTPSTKQRDGEATMRPAFAEGRVAEIEKDGRVVGWQGDVDREIEEFRQEWTLLRVENPRSVVWATSPEASAVASLWRDKAARQARGET